MHGLPADDRIAGAHDGPLADPVAEGRRLIELASADGLVIRALGGVAVCLQAPGASPRLARQVKDIDLAVAKGGSRPVISLMAGAGYIADEMFNALRGSRRLLFHDPANGRHLDVFVGEFSMCHDIPLTARLSREPLTVPLEELLLTKLQIVELTPNDQGDIFNLLFHHEVTGDDPGDSAGQISAPFIAGLCAGDWGLWRTCQLSLDRSLRSLDDCALDQDERERVAVRVRRLQHRIETEPKGRRWRMRNQVGDRVRWYAEPEEEAAGT
jgi:hypothetical protein